MPRDKSSQGWNKVHGAAPEDDVELIGAASADSATKIRPAGADPKAKTGDRPGESSTGEAEEWVSILGCCICCLCVLFVALAVWAGQRINALSDEVKGLRPDKKALSWRLVVREAMQVSGDSRLYIARQGDCRGAAKERDVLHRFEGKAVALSDCKRLCDATPGCAALSYERFHGKTKKLAGKGTLCILRNATCEVAPGPCDWTEKLCHWTYEHLLPTKCPAEMPPSDPYWYQTSTTDKWDERCNKTAGCRNARTNRVRVDTLRYILNATDHLMRRQKVQYTLMSGSLIGVARCGDIVPWDEDVDVQILEADRDKLFKLTPGNWNRERSLSLGFIGFPDVWFWTFDAPKHCFPFRVVHMPTGLFLDIFAPVIKTMGAKLVSRRPWVFGKHRCDAARDYASWPGKMMTGCPWVKCDVTPYELIWPSQRCRFADFEVSCPRSVQGYMDNLYFEGKVPDQLTRDEA